MNDTQTLELVAVENAIPKSNAPALQNNNPSSFMLQALAQGATLEQLEKMMELQERFERREAEKAYNDAFAAFRGHNITVPKSKLVDRGKAGSFNQAEYEDICKRISPALSENGLSFSHDQKFGSKRWMTDGVENDVAWVYVTCILAHRLGHSVRLDLDGPPGDLSANTVVQNMQVTASYLKRQSLLAITGTATGGEDDESNMRKHSKNSNDQDTSDLDIAIEAGREAAMGGMKALTTWWGALTAKQRSELNSEFPKLRAAAQLADRGGANA